MEREQLTSLVLAAQKGDSAAIGELFNAFQNTVYNIALRETKDPDTAADVTQEAFIEVIQTIDKLQEPAAFVTWLKTIVYHQCTRYYRKKENKHETLVEERDDAPGVFDTLEEENEEFIPDKAMENVEFCKTIRAFIDKLPDAQRSAIMMKYFDDLSVKEIAAVQGVTENTVLSRLYYGRNAIKAEVEAYEKHHDIKLHAVPFLPLLRFLFNETPKQMSAKAAIATAKAIGSATGVQIVATVGGTAAAAGTAATVAGTAAAVAGTAASTATGGGILAAVGAIPLSIKIGAGVAAAVIAISAPVAVKQVMKNDPPAEETTTTISTRAEEDTVTADIPADAVIYHGHAYKLYPETGNWEDASARCDALGGHLLTVTDEEEQAFLDGCLEGSDKPGYWIGGVQTADGWGWVTGEEMTYTNWDEGVPGDEPCLYALGLPRARSRQNGVGNWRSASFDEAAEADFGYICEWDYVPAQTTTTTTAPVGGTTVPTEGTTLPAEDGMTPTASETLPTGDVTAPTEGATTPTEDATAPTEGATTPTEDVTTPTEEATTPTEDATIPTEDATTPTQSVANPSESVVPSTQGSLGGLIPTESVTGVPTTVPATQMSSADTLATTQQSTRPVTRPVTQTTATAATVASTAPAITAPTTRVTTTQVTTTKAPTTTKATTTTTKKPTTTTTTAKVTTATTTVPTTRVTTVPTTVKTTTTATTTTKVTTTTTKVTTTTAAYGGVATIAVSDAKAAAGDTITVTVRMANNPGIVSTKVLVGYNANVLTLEKYTAGDFAVAGYSYGNPAKSPFVVNWCNAIGSNDTAELLVTLTFKVSANAAPGRYPLTLSYDNEGDIYNSTWDTVYFSADEGVVTVVD